LAELRDDIAFCAQRDRFPLIAMAENGMITKA